MAGAQAGYTKNEVHVPIIFSGKGYENKVYNAAILAPARDNDNILGIVKNPEPADIRSYSHRGNTFTGNGQVYD